MKLWNLVTFSTALILTFSGCTPTPTPADKSVVDSTLPVVTLSEHGVFTDMKAIGFEWNKIEDPRVNGIYVFKQTLGDDSAEPVYEETIENRFVTHFVDSNVEPESQYNYYFKTFSKDSESLPSKITTVSTLPILDSVSWIYAAQDMPRSAKIIWRPHTNQIVKYYVLERKTLEEDEWSELKTIKGRLNAEYIDTELKDDFVYKYRVRVVTYNGITSKPSKEVKVVTKALPVEVENITATQDLPKKIMLKWNPTTQKDFEHYNVYKSTSIDGGYDLLVSTKNNNYVDSIEEDGKDYFYRVSVIDVDGLESKNDLLSAHGKTLSRPTTPSLVEARMAGDNLEITWNSTDDRVKSYSVVKKSKKGWFSSAGEEFVDIKGKTFLDGAIEPSTTYYYTVYSIDEFGIKSYPSIEVMFTTSESQGKMIQPTIKDESSVTQTPTQEPANTQTQNVVQPMDDFGMSEL